MEDSDVFNRIFDKLDKHDERLNQTCNTMTEIKTTLFGFIDAVNRKEQETQKNIENKYKKITALFGTITSISVLIGIAKVFGVI